MMTAFFDRSMRLALLAALVGGAVSCRGSGRTASAAANGSLAITNVSVIPMTSDTVIRDATVVVRDGRIFAVGARDDVSVPSDAAVIDGSGKYLIPGLADMHTHLFSDGDQVHDSAGSAELGIMLANGVTTARLMMGTPEQLALRKGVADGRIVGPTLWVASPQLTGRPSENAIVVTTPREARAAVKTAHAAGYDFIKITLFISSAVYDAIVSEAKTLGIKVVGHVDPEVGVARALAAGQQIEHLDGYFEATLADSAPTRVSVTQMLVFASRNWLSLDHIDNRKIDSIAGATARAGVFVGPTQNIFNTAFAIGETEADVKARPDWEAWPAKTREQYLGAHRRYWDPARAGARTESRRRRYVEIRNRLVKAMQDSGGKILAGSDTPEWFHAYGWGLHRELQALVSAGLTPYQALAAATSTPAEFLGNSRNAGTIAAGKRADLILLSANPLEDIRNTTKIEGVSVGGRWLNRMALDSLLASGVQRIRLAAPKG